MLRAIQFKLSLTLKLIIIFSLFLTLLYVTLKPEIPTQCKEQYDFDQTLHGEDAKSQGIDKNDIDNMKNKKRCDTIHIAAVCGGFNATRSLYVLLKSILFRRTDVIHLHLLVDNISHLILEKLFDSLSVPELKVSFYNATEHETDISWIRNQHYSSQYGLLKLPFIGILSKHLDRVILMDTDMLCLGNINRLWSEFENMKQVKKKGDRPAFGMVENQSDWYLNDSTPGRIVWPAIGRGFNSGLILIDFHELKRVDWDLTWRQVSEDQLTSNLITTLADQDILNSIIRVYSDIIYVLPCYFNLQLNDHSQNYKSCHEFDDFKIIHWNSPYKLDNKNPLSEYYRNWYLIFTNWDASLVSFNHCISLDGQIYSQKLSNRSTTKDFICKDIQPKPTDKLRTYLYFMEFEHSFVPWDVTLVAHLSSDRLQVLNQLAGNWLGPMSVSIYLTELETSLLISTIESSSNLSRRKNIGYHLVFRDHGFNYPINRMRNIALNNVLTEYVLQSDVDFLPSTNLYEYLKSTISKMSLDQGNSKNPLTKRALVIPAFETQQYRFEFPSNKADLIEEINLGHIMIFKQQIWRRGHAPTDYSKWVRSTKPYSVAWQPDYEPFVVTSKDAPRFDERFVGFGWNKVENIMHMAALGYEFIVLPEAFLVHEFHSASYDIIKHRESSKYRTCMRYLRRIFLHELEVKFPNFVESFNSSTY